MSNDQYNVKRRQNALALAHGASATTAQAAGVSLNGELWQVNTLAPAAVDASATLTVNVIDADGITVYTKGSLAANSKTGDKLTAPVALSGLYTIQVVFSAAQTATDTVTNVNLIVKA